MSAAALLGDAGWSDAMLQPALFPLAEMAGEILRLECIYYRMGWLNDSNTLLAQNSPDYIPIMHAAAQRAADRAIARLEHFDGKYVSAWERVRGGLDMPEVVVADAALAGMAEKPSQHYEAPGALDAPVRVLSLVRPIADLSPRPRISDGELRELVWRLDPADLAGLSQMLALKAQSGPQVIVDVLMPGGPEHDALLRMAGGVRADGLFRLDLGPAAGPPAYIKTVKDLEALQRYDLIVIGADCRNGDQSLGAYLAGALKRLHYRREKIEVKTDGSGFLHVALPAVIGVTAMTPEPLLSMTDAVGSMVTRIRVLELAGRPAAVSERFEQPVGSTAITQMITTVGQAAEYLKTYAASASAAAAPDYKGSVTKGILSDGDAVWAALDPNEPKANLAVLRASSRAADLLGKKMRAAIAAPRPLWPQLLGLARANGCEQAYCIDTKNGRLSNDGKRYLLRSLIKTSNEAFVFARTEWAGSFAFVAGEHQAGGKTIVLCSGVTGIEKQTTGRLVFSRPVY